MMLEVNGLTKFAEKDVYGEGCQPGTDTLVDIDVSFTAETQEELIEEIVHFTGANPDNVRISDIDQSRIEVSVYENEYGYHASDREIEQWRDGDIDLWSCQYRAYVEEVERKEATLEPLEYR